MADEADKRAQELKARLGLLDTKRQTSKSGGGAGGEAEPSSPASAGRGAATGDEASEPRRAAAAHEPGRSPAADEQDVEEHEESPVASAAEAGPRLSDAELAAPSQPSRAPLYVAVGVLLLVFCGGGYFLGTVFNARAVENARTADAGSLRDYIKNHKNPQTSQNTLEEIDKHKAAILTFAKKAREAKEKNDLVSIQSDLVGFLRDCQQFQLSFDLEGALRTPFYAGDLIPAVARFSAAVARFGAANAAVGREAGLVAYIVGRQAEREQNPGGTTRRFLIGQQEIEGVPWSAGRPIANMMQPERATNPETGEAGDWQVGVLEAGQEKGVMVSPTQVVLINIETDIRELEGDIQRFALSRVLDRVLELETIAKEVDPAPVLSKLDEVAKRPAYFTF